VLSGLKVNERYKGIADWRTWLGYIYIAFAEGM